MTSEDASKLFVAGLPESIDEDVLRGLFEATGAKVANVSLPKDRATGRPRGFGFVTLSSPDEATRARQELDGSLQSGRSISVRPFQAEVPRRNERQDHGAPPSAEPSGSAPAGEDKTLYVGNLPYDTSAGEVKTVLEQAGVEQILRTHLPVQPDGRLRGFGFVTVATVEAAEAAVEKLREVEVRGRRLTVNIAHPRGGGPAGDSPSQAGDRGPRRPRPHHAAPSEGGRAPRMDSMPPMSAPPFEASSRPLEGRRARTAEGKKKKKKKEKEKSAGEPTRHARDRGGAGSWHRWADWDED